MASCGVVRRCCAARGEAQSRRMISERSVRMEEPGEREKERRETRDKRRETRDERRETRGGETQRREMISKVKLFTSLLSRLSSLQPRRLLCLQAFPCTTPRQNCSRQSDQTHPATRRRGRAADEVCSRGYADRPRRGPRRPRSPLPSCPA